MLKISLKKFKYPLLALACGALINLAFAPYYIWPVLFISLPALFFILEQSKTLKSCLINVFLFGYAKSLIGLSWISNSLLVDIQFLWLRPISIMGIPILVCFYSLLFGVLYYYIGKNNNHKLLKVISFATIWVMVEIISCFMPLGGFPWNLLGYAALVDINLAQLANLGTVFLLSFLVLCAALPLYYVAVNIRKNWAYIGLPLVIILSSYFYGSTKIDINRKMAIDTIKIKVVQPNIPQRQKWNSPIQELKASLNISKLGAQDYELLIWPETSIPQSLDLSKRAPIINLVAQDLPANAKLISGLVRNDGANSWNSSVIFGSDYMVTDEPKISYYDKHKLVPFGEYIPLSNWPLISYLTKPFQYRGFSSGEGARTLDVKLADRQVKVALAICYEIIFPFQVVDEKNLPDILVNITNDAWFGDSVGPPQHLMKAQMRAIELGVPVVRAANTGISAVIDKYGRVEKRLELNKAGYIDYSLPY